MGMIIAIDGPAGSGKGTIASILAKKCNLINIDTGAMYRALTLKVLRNKIDFKDEEKIIELLKNTELAFNYDNKILLDGEDVSAEIRTNEVSDNVSLVSPIPKVRDMMKEMQRAFAKNNNIVIEGRDITTEVFPNANYKFYLDASIEERAKRRLLQNLENGIESSYEEIFDNIKNRDYNDMNRQNGALKIASDAIYIDTTNKSIDEVVTIILAKIKE